MTTKFFVFDWLMDLSQPSMPNFPDPNQPQDFTQIPETTDTPSS
jgi:hypothetical protein